MEGPDPRSDVRLPASAQNRKCPALLTHLPTTPVQWGAEVKWCLAAETSRSPERGWACHNGLTSMVSSQFMNQGGTWENRDVVVCEDERP
jgi:hypothetical protein